MEDRKRVRVLVLWADPDAENLGLQALAAGARLAATEIWGPCDVVFHTHNTAGTPLTRLAAQRDLAGRRGGMTEYFKTFNVILDTGGGDSFTDIYGLRRLLLMKYVRYAAKKARRPVVMTPQTVGPFETRVGKMVGKSMLRGCAFVCTRDPESAAYARKLGRQADVESTDMAFALGKLRRSQLYDVVINVSGLLWNPNPHVDYLGYRSSVIELIEELSKRGRRISLLAHVLSSNLMDNDVPAVEAAASASGISVDVLIPRDLADVRRILASTEVLIGSRMHSSINALAVGTVAIPWSYSRKFAPLMASIGWDCTVDLRSGLDPVAETLGLLGSTNFGNLQESVLSVNDRADAMIRSFTGSPKWSSISDAMNGASV
ncbi:polysaccharide pyruvyl transferase family protein [Rhodococcus sovatensis]|uniref:Polysaccharide pyruvyl transferase family protein n=1 Tax=Rhodococcus sovatensis TaxID=1805840 RepID=A0ABZ2PKJ4_9NOCA